MALSYDPNELSPFRIFTWGIRCFFVLVFLAMYCRLLLRLLGHPMNTTSRNKSFKYTIQQMLRVRLHSMGTINRNNDCVSRNLHVVRRTPSAQTIPTKRLDSRWQSSNSNEMINDLDRRIRATEAFHAPANRTTLDDSLVPPALMALSENKQWSIRPTRALENQSIVSAGIPIIADMAYQSAVPAGIHQFYHQPVLHETGKEFNSNLMSALRELVTLVSSSRAVYTSPPGCQLSMQQAQEAHCALKVDKQEERNPLDAGRHVFANTAEYNNQKTKCADDESTAPSTNHTGTPITQRGRPITPFHSANNPPQDMGVQNRQFAKWIQMTHISPRSESSPQHLESSSEKISVQTVQLEDMSYPEKTNSNTVGQTVDIPETSIESATSNTEDMSKLLFEQAKFSGEFSVESSPSSRLEDNQKELLQKVVNFKLLMRQLEQGNAAITGSNCSSLPTLWLLAAEPYVDPKSDLAVSMQANRELRSVIQGALEFQCKEVPEAIHQFLVFRNIPIDRETQLILESALKKFTPTSISPSELTIDADIFNGSTFSSIHPSVISLKAGHVLNANAKEFSPTASHITTVTRLKPDAPAFVPRNGTKEAYTRKAVQPPSSGPHKSGVPRFIHKGKKRGLKKNVSKDPRTEAQEPYQRR